MDNNNYTVQSMNDAYQLGLEDGVVFAEFIQELNANITSLNRYQIALIDIISEYAPSMSYKLTRELVHRYQELKDNEEHNNG